MNYFNPRSREGSDFLVPAVVRMTPRFQSTLPRGERPKFFHNFFGIFSISIHAPARGATVNKT